MKYRVIITDPVSDEGKALLAEGGELEAVEKLKLPPEDLAEEIKGFDGLIIRSGTQVTAGVIESADRLKVIGRAGVGVDNIDIEAATRKGIVVMNMPGGNTIAAAEHTMTLMLALSRNISRADSSLKSGKWERTALVGRELKDKNLGVIGFGRIGREVAARAKAFGMEIIAYDPFVSHEMIAESGARAAELDDVIKEADYLTVHIPLSDETRYLIDSPQFDMMKDGVRIINCARGGLINEEELLVRLQSGKVAGAALDVFEKEPPEESPLFDRDDVLVTPHLGASTEEAKKGVSLGICSQVRDFLLEGRAVNALNMPMMDSEMMSRLEPLIKLAEKLGHLQCQLSSGGISRIEVTCQGDIEEVKPITLGVLTGLLDSSTSYPVNSVNALHVARERGISVSESLEHEEGDYGNLIRTVLEGDRGSRIVAGALFGQKHMRIVQVDEFHMEVRPEGVILMLTSHDVPGVIGKVGTLLGEAGVNIGEFRLGRRNVGDVALSMVNLDEPAPGELLEKLRSLDEIVNVEQVRL